jgi:fibronectin type 3 domain-containing protein
MATYVDKLTVGQRPTQTTFTSANGSTTRKFTSVDANENNSPTDSTSNAEHIITAGSSAKSLALTLPALAAQAIAQIQATTAALAAITPAASGNIRQPVVTKTETDVNNLQTQLAAAAATSFNSVADPNLRGMLQRRTGNYVSDSRNAVVPIKQENADTIPINTIVPSIEEVRVDIDKNSSAVDYFYAGMLFNLTASSDNNVQAVRIFRAQVTNPNFTRPLATLSSEGIQRLQSYRGRKNEDPSAFQMRLASASVPNSVTNLNYIGASGFRVSTPGSSALIIPPPFAGQNPSQRVQNTSVPDSLALADPSVLNDVNTIMNLQNNPVFTLSASASASSSAPSIQVGANINTGFYLGAQAQVQVSGNISNSNLIIVNSNALSFSELAITTLDKLKSRQVGNFIEYQYIDESVSYGCGYKYFIVSLDENMVQSARSQLADAVIEVIRIPDPPSLATVNIAQASVALAITSADQLVEKFEIYRLEDNAYPTTQSNSPTIADQMGFTQKNYTRGIADNNYLLIGESMNGQKTGGQYIDNDIKPGIEYTYRVYAVDIFGNKSESPYELSAYVPDLEAQHVKLTAPALLTEVDAKSGFMRVTFRSDDSNVESLWLARRDLTIGQEGFVNPYSPSRTVLGSGRLVEGRNYLQGERMYDMSPDTFWTGYFLPRTGRNQVFIDTTAAQDHIYQYQIYGKDRYGNKTPYVVSSPLLVVLRRFINAPTGLAAQLIYDVNNQVSGVNVSWVESNIDKAAEDLLGSQAALADTSVRTLYQVQRQHQGEATWLNFSLISGTSLFDPLVGVAAVIAPNTRPPYPDVNQTYMYRVQAVQTGAYISNFTAPAQVFTGFAVGQPLNFTLRTPPVARTPFFIMLNWDTQGNSGVVDKWEVQRAAVNNFAAAGINSQNLTAVQQLQFQSFVMINREAGRFSGKVQDAANSTGSVNTALITGQNYYMDTQVDFGNTYFYRIRAISPEGVQSQWSYKGTKLTTTIFEQKYIPLLTDAEKQILATSYQPLLLTRAVVTVPSNSLSVSTDRSLPDSKRSYPRTSSAIATGGE